MALEVGPLGFLNLPGYLSSVTIGGRQAVDFLRRRIESVDAINEVITALAEAYQRGLIDVAKPLSNEKEWEPGSWANISAADAVARVRSNSEPALDKARAEGFVDALLMTVEPELQEGYSMVALTDSITREQLHEQMNARLEDVRSRAFEEGKQAVATTISESIGQLQESIWGYDSAIAHHRQKFSEAQAASAKAAEQMKILRGIYDSIVPKKEPK